MMSATAFGEQFDQLCIAFNASNIANRGKVYFKYLSHVQDHQFPIMVQAIIKNESRMPSISDMLTMHRKMFMSEAVNYRCTQCNGSGMRKIGAFLYKTSCEHGQKLKLKIGSANQSLEILLQNQETALGEVYGKEVAKEMIDRCRDSPENDPQIEKAKGVDKWLAYMTSNPEKALKGLVNVLPIMKGKYKYYSELREAVIDFYGEDYLKKHARKLQQNLTGSL